MKRLATALSLTLCCSLGQAEPFVIYDAGQGVSTASYTHLFSGEEIPDFRDSWLFQDLPETDAVAPTPKKTFPLTTAKLTPRLITEEQATYFAVMFYPICVIGTDELSREWLKRNRQALIEMNAQCLLVSAASQADARSLLELTQGLSVYPAHGDAIADYFKIAHYPVLITQRDDQPMSTQPVEALLRPPVEYFSGCAYLTIGALAAVAPSTLMMTPSVAIATATGLCGLGLYRLHQGSRLRRYQKGLRRLKTYRIASKQIPVSHSKLFIGMGFEWDGRHTQRLANLQRNEGRKYKEQGLLYRWARRFALSHERFLQHRGQHGMVVSYAHLLSRVQQHLNHCRRNPLCHGMRFLLDNNPMTALPPVGGDPTLHAVGLYEGERPVHMDLGDRVGHTLVLGTTRVGKTRLAELLIAQDIRRGDVVIVFDPKGDADLFMRMYVEAKQANRLDRFHFFHLGYPELSARYNPVGSFARVTEVAGRIAGQLPGEGQSATFREFVWRYVNVIAKALTALGRPVDYAQILDYGQDIEPLVRDYLELLADQDDPSGDWKSEVEAILGYYEDGANKQYRYSREQGSRDHQVIALHRYCKDQGLFDAVAKSLSRTYEYDRGYFDKLVSSLLPLMEKLTTGKCSELLSPDYLDQDDSRPIFSWAEIIHTQGIVYVGLDALTDPEVAGAVGNAMFSDLTSTAGQLYKQTASEGLAETGNKPPAINIHADEFNELIGDEFIPMLNKAGGAGYQVTAYTQTWSDVEARLQDRAKAGQVAGNFNTLLMLRVREVATAEMLTQQLQQTEINHLMLVSGATDSSDLQTDTHFVSKTEQRITTQQVDLIHVNHLMSLPKGQCFGLLDGGRPYKIRLPLADKADLAGIPDSLQSIAEDMRLHYSTSEDWYRFTPSWVKTEA